MSIRMTVVEMRPMPEIKTIDVYSSRSLMLRLLSNMPGVVIMNMRQIVYHVIVC